MVIYQSRKLSGVFVRFRAPLEYELHKYRFGADSFLTPFSADKMHKKSFSSHRH
jgi:hypothetical protein